MNFTEEREYLLTNNYPSCDIDSILDEYSKKCNETGQIEFQEFLKDFSSQSYDFMDTIKTKNSSPEWKYDENLTNELENKLKEQLNIDDENEWLTDEEETNKFLNSNQNIKEDKDNSSDEWEYNEELTNKINSQFKDQLNIDQKKLNDEDETNQFLNSNKNDNNIIKESKFIDNFSSFIPIGWNIDKKEKFQIPNDIIKYTKESLNLEYKKNDIAFLYLEKWYYLTKYNENNKLESENKLTENQTNLFNEILKTIKYNGTNNILKELDIHFSLTNKYIFKINEWSNKIGFNLIQNDQSKLYQFDEQLNDILNKKINHFNITTSYFNFIRFPSKENFDTLLINAFNVGNNFKLKKDNTSFKKEVIGRIAFTAPIISNYLKDAKSFDTMIYNENFLQLHKILIQTKLYLDNKDNEYIKNTPFEINKLDNISHENKVVLLSCIDDLIKQTNNLYVSDFKKNNNEIFKNCFTQAKKLINTID